MIITHRNIVYRDNRTQRAILVIIQQHASTIYHSHGSVNAAAGEYPTDSGHYTRATLTAALKAAERTEPK